ncbi:hypothetical protein LX69_01640 [Breznakibacter xylanolyticus]|uniref:Transmembrane protein n=1 Tax=Breznakibacter xylanolyticus TaxID=990 RepID=A0A2W7NU22_9BACT|nr:DUF6057 family protein [Breznakibacter xylanolyticus]PZX16826.1 hypothetical protein LX69_01640 [Breznakibacter xylanolyticus]
MNRFLKSPLLLSLLFGIGVFLFWTFGYSYHLNYQEQYQLFLFTGDYLFDYLSRPGGLSDYLGNFITQFYFYSWIGALMIVLLLVLIQQGVWALSRQWGAALWTVPLSFVPSLLYWGVLCDENYLIGGVIALLLVLAAMWGWSFVFKRRWRMALLLVSLPLLYWACGGLFLLFPLYVMTYERKHASVPRSSLLGWIVAVMLTVVLVLLSGRMFALQYPLDRMMVGVSYYRYPHFWPLPVIAIGVMVLLISLFGGRLSMLVSPRRQLFAYVVTIVVIVAGGFGYVSASADFSKEEVMAYDFQVRMRRWDRVIAMADHKQPMSPLSVTCLNLALAKQDLLGDRMFHYYQNGVGGLLPDFVRDYTIPMITGEVYYHLGMINTSQRYTFEAMEALPDYQKSVRAVKRLAETNIINGEYRLARKYLTLLSQTLYYRDWAQKALLTIADEGAVNEHSEWGVLRKMKPVADFFYSEQEKDMMLGLLFQQQPDNKMAFDYLLVHCLLRKDLQHFWKYFSLGESFYGRRIPKAFEEALVAGWSMQQRSPSEAMPFPVSTTTRQRFDQFARNVRSGGEGTYWDYLQRR